jgi:hypothetical protein
MGNARRGEPMNGAGLEQRLVGPLHRLREEPIADVRGAIRLAAGGGEDELLPPGLGLFRLGLVGARARPVLGQELLRVGVMLTSRTPVSVFA